MIDMVFPKAICEALLDDLTDEASITTIVDHWEGLERRNCTVGCGRMYYM